MDEQQDSATGEKTTRRPTDRRAKLVFLVVLLVVVGGVYWLQVRRPKLTGWGGDLDKALAQARRQGTKTVVVFTANPPGQVDRKLIQECLDWPSSKKVLKHLGHLTVRLDVESDGVAAEKYEVVDTPTILLLDAEGQVLKRYEGFMREGDFCTEFLGISAKDIPR